MKIKIGDTTYDPKSANELSLLDLLTLERETRDLGRPLTMSVIAGMETAVSESVKAAQGIEAKRRARQEHPESAWLLAVMIWATRRHAGEHVSFEDAISFPLSDLDFIVEVGDPDDIDVDPQQARQGSVVGAGHLPKRNATKTSRKPSTVG